MCPSNPDLYPFIKGLYRDLLRRFDDSPVIGIGCSEIDMQWQGTVLPGVPADASTRARQSAISCWGTPRSALRPCTACRPNWVGRCGR